MRTGVSIEQFIATCSHCDLAEHPGYSCEEAIGVFFKPDQSGPDQLERIEQKLDKLIDRFFVDIKP